MITLEGRDQWVCLNPGCGAKIEVVKFSGVDETSDPICFCGSAMRNCGADQTALAETPRFFSKESSKEEIGKQKHPYSTPTLTIYGKIHELTKMVGTTGPLDGGGGGMVKTAV